MDSIDDFFPSAPFEKPTRKSLAFGNFGGNAMMYPSGVLWKGPPKVLCIHTSRYGSIDKELNTQKTLKYQ